MQTDTSDANVAAPGLPPHVQVIQMATAYWVSRAVFASAHFRIADLLKDGPQAAETLAAATGTHVPTLRRVLRALASIGLFRTDGRGASPSRRLAPLCSRTPTGPHALPYRSPGDFWWPAWGEFLRCMRTGGDRDRKVHDPNVFICLPGIPSYVALRPAMIGFHGAEPPTVVEAYDPRVSAHSVDVGAAPGTCLSRS